MLEKTQIQRLLDIALLGCKNGQVGLARKVIDGLDQVLETSPELEICRAMSFYTVDQFEPALEILNRAGAAFAGNQMVMAHKGLTLALMGNKDDARRILDTIVQNSLDPDAVALSRALLDEAC